MMLVVAISGRLKPPMGNTARAIPKEDPHVMCVWLCNGPNNGERFWQRYAVVYFLIFGPHN